MMQLEMGIGEQHVEYRQIRGGTEHQVGTRVVGKGGDRDPFASERALDRFADGRLVLDEHHPWRVRAHKGSIAARS